MVAVAGAVLVSARSAVVAEVICTEALVELFVETGSVTLLATVAVLTTVPAVMGLTNIATWVLAELARVPRAQVTVVVPEQVPWLATVLNKATPAGNTSMRVTPVATEGPLLVTVIR